MEFIVEARCEVESLIERLRLGVDGMNQDRANAEDVRGVLDPDERVLEERRTEIGATCQAPFC